MLLPFFPIVRTDQLRNTDNSSLIVEIDNTRVLGQNQTINRTIMIHVCS